jgi:hypothetical protein
MKPPQTLAGRAGILLGILLLIVGTVVIGAAFALHRGPWARSTQAQSAPFDPIELTGGPVIATVDGTAIYLDEARMRVSGLASTHGGETGSTGVAPLGKDWQDRVLQSLVDDRILQAEADDRGIVVTRAEVAESLSGVREMFQSDQGFQDWLTSNGMTREELERRIWLQAIAGSVYLDVTAQVSVPAAELREYYRSNKDLYVGVDGTALPFVSVRSSIREAMLKEARDSAYAEWLDRARAAANVVIAEPDWWKELR